MKPSFRRARGLEAWLRELMAAYQDWRHRPRNREYSNLARMPRPTQMYAIALKHGSSYDAVVLVTHRKDVRNGRALAIKVDSLEELARFSEVADDFFGTAALQRSDDLAGRILLPQTGVAQQACTALAQAWRDCQRLPQPPRGSFQVGMQQLVQIVPPAALWQVVYRPPLPRARRALLALGTQRRPRTVTATSSPVPTERRATPQGAVAYAAFCQPLLWFGSPPCPSPQDRILGRPWFPERDQRLLHRRLVGHVDTLVYNTGLILAVADDRHVARSTINQVFGALSRSGVGMLAVSDFELIEVHDVDVESGALRSYHGALTPRNRLLDMPTRDRSPRISYCLSEEVVAPLVDLADCCARDRDGAVASLRLLNAATLLGRQSLPKRSSWDGA